LRPLGRDSQAIFLGLYEEYHNYINFILTVIVIPVNCAHIPEVKLVHLLAAFDFRPEFDMLPLPHS
jgi:hypothetical protein